jgi:hypothetical protein
MNNNDIIHQIMLYLLPLIARIKVNDARNYMKLSRDSFNLWCESVNLKSYKYEFSNRKYFIEGEFYAKADFEKIQRIIEIHSEKWIEFYSHADKVLPFTESNTKELPQIKSQYTPKSESVSNFIKELRK